MLTSTVVRAPPRRASEGLCFPLTRTYNAVRMTQMVRTSSGGSHSLPSSHAPRGLSSQPSGFYLAIWRMRLLLLSPILVSRFRRGV